MTHFHFLLSLAFGHFNLTTLKPKEVGKLDPLTCLSFYYKKKNIILQFTFFFWKERSIKKRDEEFFPFLCFHKWMSNHKGEIPILKIFI